MHCSTPQTSSYSRVFRSDRSAGFQTCRLLRCATRIQAVRCRSPYNRSSHTSIPRLPSWSAVASLRDTAFGRRWTFKWRLTLRSGPTSDTGVLPTREDTQDASEFLQIFPVLDGPWEALFDFFRKHWHNELEENIEHRTSNIERRRKRGEPSVRCWAFDVRCSMFPTVHGVRATSPSAKPLTSPPTCRGEALRSRVHQFNNPTTHAVPVP